MLTVQMVDEWKFLLLNVGEWRAGSTAWMDRCNAPNVSLPVDAQPSALVPLHLTLLLWPEGSAAPQQRPRVILKSGSFKASCA